MKNAAKKFMRQLSEYELITIDEKSNNRINKILSSNFKVEFGFDSPDIPLIYDAKMIALEEFEFDSSKTKKNQVNKKKKLLSLTEK